LGLSKLYQNEIYLIFGIIFSIAFVLENAIIDILVKPVFRDNNFHKKLMTEINGGKSWSKSNIFLKLAGIYPFQGLLYSDTFVQFILLISAIIEYILNLYLGFSVRYGIISIYFIIVSLSKLTWTLGFIFKIERKGYITKVMNKGK